MTENQFEHLRHKPPTQLEQPRQIVLACPPLRSQINLARIVRAAGCMGITKMIVCGNGKVDRKIARDAVDSIELEVHRSLAPQIPKFRAEGFRIIGLEQTSNSRCIYDYEFPRKTLLVIGNERSGINDDILRLLDDTIEIPVYGMPYSFNVATATCMAIYEYCRQYPQG